VRQKVATGVHSEAHCFICAQVACLREHDLHNPRQLYSNGRAEHGLGFVTQMNGQEEQHIIPTDWYQTQQKKDAQHIRMARYPWKRPMVLSWWNGLIGHENGLIGTVRNE